MVKRVAILGSTGSIGQQTLDIIARNRNRFAVELLTANNNVDLLVSQALSVRPRFVAIANKELYPQLVQRLQGAGINVYCGIDDIVSLVADTTADVIVGAIVGYAGLKPTIKAVERGKCVALANKESLVVAGSIINAIKCSSGASIVPVDSEHSAIFQCLQGEQLSKVEKIILTASGGPFIDYSIEQLKEVDPAAALRHPNWSMGSKVTIDSASLMNKGLEVIEARWLFDMPLDKIDVLIHQQSIVHSMVSYCDGSIKAQMGVPDMRMPILYALGYPERIESSLPRADLAAIGKLTFSKPDISRFRNLALAYEALRLEGNMPCVLNAANEVAVKAFLANRIGFLQMTEIVEYCLENIAYIRTPNLSALDETNEETYICAEERIKYISK